MEAAERQQLMDYMKAAIDLETAIATQEEIIRACKEQHAKREPALRLVSHPQKPEKPEYKTNGMFSGSNITKKGHLVLIGGFSLFFMLIMFASSALFFSIICGIIGVLCFISVIQSNKETEEYNGSISRQYMEKMEKYKKECSKIDEQNAGKRRVYDRDLSIWNENGQTNLRLLQGRLDQTRGLLDQLYAQGTIYPKYCNLPALTSMYEYFITGRCEELTGPHGAYNLYEDELRKDTVISQLNVVIENLEKIRQNQYMLYQQVKSIQQTAAQISSEMEQIKGLTFDIARLSALNTYYSAITAVNSEISATYHLMNG